MNHLNTARYNSKATLGINDTLHTCTNLNKALAAIFQKEKRFRKAQFGIKTGVRGGS